MMRMSGPSFRWGIMCVAAVISMAGWHELRRPAFELSYRMPADGQLTLGLYNTKGALLRWLVQDDFRHSGTLHASWDGLDQWGRKVPPGNYLLQGAYHAPLQAEYLMTLC